MADLKNAKPDDPAVQSMVDVFSTTQIGTAEPIRAADLLLAVDQLSAAIARPPRVA